MDIACSCSKLEWQFDDSAKTCIILVIMLTWNKNMVRTWTLQTYAADVCTCESTCGATSLMNQLCVTDNDPY